MNDLELIVGAKAIAAILNVAPRRLYEMVDQGHIPTIKIGSSVAIRKSKLVAWISALEAA